MEQVVIFLPLPESALFPNDKSHWRVKARQTKLARWRANCAAREAMGVFPGPQWRRVVLIPRFAFPGRCRFDPTNLMASLKAYIDGLQDAGVILNDRGLWPERPEIITDPGLADHPNARMRRGMVRMVIRPEEETNEL